MPSVAPRPLWSPEEYRQKPRELDYVIADDVLERLANGDSLLTICASPDMPLPATFVRWTREDPTLAERYEDALRLGCEVTFDMVAIQASDPDPSRARVLADAAKWRAERQMPAKYGPRAVIATPKSDDVAGIDYAAEVRRKLEEMTGA